MSIKQRLFLFAGFYVVIIALVGFVAYAAVSAIDADLKRLNQAQIRKDLYEEMRAAGAEFLMVPERWIHTWDPEERSVYEPQYLKLKESLEKAFPVAESGEERTILERISETVSSLRQVGLEIMSIDAAGTQDDRTREVLMIFEAHEKIFIDQVRRLVESATAEAGMALRESESLRHRMYRFFAFIFLLVMGLTIYFVLRVARWMTTPVQSLMRGAEEISRGDFEYRIDMKRSDEFGTLSSTFDRMSTVLGTSHRRLSAKLLESEILMEVARMANSTLELEVTLKKIVDLIAERLERDVCSVYLATEDGLSVVLRASRGLDPESVGRVRLGLGEGVVGRAASEMKPLAVRDVKSDTMFQRLPESDAWEFSSMLAVPVVHENTCKGVLTVQTRDPHDYSEDEQQLLTLISHNVASAIRNAELYGHTRSQLMRLKGIYELGMTINSILDLDMLLADICRKTAEMLSAEGAIVRLIEGDVLIIRSSWGLPETYETMKPLPVGEGIAGKVAMDGMPMLVEDTGKLPESLRVPGVQTKSVLSVPLKLGSRVIGTIGHYNKSVDGHEAVFTATDLETLTAIAGMAAIAIENARLYLEEKTREEEIREANNRLNTLFESVQGGILTVNQNMVILSANRYVERWTRGSKAGSIVGSNCQEAFGEGFEICPDNPVQVTFETGKSTKISRKVSIEEKTYYLEITTYPLQERDGAVREVIVFMQDISDRMRAEEEILSLYSEVNQTKKYLESLITNSADAIITTDLEGLVASWNKGAERIYGYKAEEVLNQPIPIMPDFLLPAERENNERIRRKEILRDVETLRKTKDGSLIEVSLTLSPILDEQGDVIGISGISRDITDKRRVEQELTRRNQELSRLLFISNAMRSTLDINRLLRMTLTAVTVSDGLGFNRALLFEVDEEAGMIRGVMGVGPGSLEEAWRVWGELAMERRSLEEIMNGIVAAPVTKDSFLDRLAMNIEVPMNESSESILAHVVSERAPVNILDARSDPRVDPILIQQLGTEAFALIPLISQDSVVGVLWMDNLFNRRPITDDDIRFLTGFGNHVASAIQSARLFEKVSMAESELKNIFESISDMVYFNDRNFTIKKVNRAVVEKLGMPEEKIVGRKCYELFHGMNEPWHRCPHDKTIRTGRSYMQELEDPYLGGTYMVSSSPIVGLSGELIGTVHISRDISESKKLREQLLKAEKMAALGEMAAKIAHEIRNPLISVGGFARRLEKKLEGPLADYATIIIDSVNHLEAILKDILGFVRETRIVLLKGDLVEILDQLLSLFSPALTERGITVEKDFREISLEVPVDSNKIREAFTNLIRNAEQALEEGGTVRIMLDRTDSEAVVEIGDNGPGISEEDCRHIFDPFFTTKMSGTGLGLAITQRIIELHRGKIEVTSEPSSGTTFRIYLPLEEE